MFLLDSFTIVAVVNESALSHEDSHGRVHAGQLGAPSQL